MQEVICQSGTVTILVFSLCRFSVSLVEEFPYYGIMEFIYKISKG